MAGENTYIEMGTRGGITGPTAPPADWTTLRMNPNGDNPKWLNPISSGLPFSRDSKWDATPTVADLDAMRERISRGNTLAGGSLELSNSTSLRPMVAGSTVDQLDPQHGSIPWTTWALPLVLLLAGVAIGLIIRGWWSGRAAG